MSFFINNKKHFVFILLFLISEVAFSPVWNHKRDVVELHLDPDCSGWNVIELPIFPCLSVFSVKWAAFSVFRKVSGLFHSPDWRGFLEMNVLVGFLPLSGIYDSVGLSLNTARPAGAEPGFFFLATFQWWSDFPAIISAGGGRAGKCFDSSAESDCLLWHLNSLWTL